jgi:tetratricopeptide (TPR) repeat protein
VWTWNSRGWGKYLQKDYDQSILDYDEAIRLDPKYVHAWNNRGLAKAAKQDYDGAILDYDEAIRLDPKYVHAWNNRGLAKAAKQDYDGAILDCDEAIRLDPKYVRAWNNRGSAKSRKQDHDGAIRDYDEAIRLDPKYAWGWYSRGLTRLVTRHSAATQDLAQVLELQGWQGDSSSYSVVFGCLAARLLGDESRAQKFLTDAEGKLKQEWPFPVLAYLQGQRSADDLLVLARDNDQQTEAHCYIGLNLLASGNTIDAREHLGWVRDHGNKSYVEFPISLAELDRLKDASQEPSSSLAATAQQPIRRVLTDASGDGQVHVDVLRLDGSTVHVRTLEGKEMTLSLDNLSELDREWLKRNFGR